MRKLWLAPAKRLCCSGPICAVVAVALATFAPVHAQSKSDIAVEGTSFQLRMSDGRTLTSRDLVGATLSLDVGGQSLKIRIEGVESDPDDAGGEILLHRLSLQRADGGWRDFCRPDRQGVRAGFPIAGRALPDGRLVPDPDRFELACTSGAQGKCVRFGYKPWRKGSDGRTLLDAYNSCIRMVRADYCGNGTSTTRDGMLIAFFDRLGVHKASPDTPMEFEAGWTPEGAVCVRHVRVKENLSLERLRTACPRLEQRLGPACDEESAARWGAILFNRSYP